jgi:hypothetical protein
MMDAERADLREMSSGADRSALPIRVGVMKDLEAVWKLARSHLVVPADGGGHDTFLWEHSVRVAKSAQYLSRLPEAQEHEPDSLALLAAALFHEAGWISRWRAGEIERFEMLMGSPTEVIISDSIRTMESVLRDLVPPASLARACATVRCRIPHTQESVEGCILTEADNLEEFGLGFLWMAIRRGVCGGKGIQAVLDAWKRRVEYHFWTARLKNAFHFTPTRRLAESRLQQLEALMKEMAVQHEVEDIRLVVESARGCPLTPLKLNGEAENHGKHKI